MEIASPWRMRSISQNPVLSVRERLRTSRLISFYIAGANVFFVCAVYGDDLSTWSRICTIHTFNKFFKFAIKAFTDSHAAGNRRVWKRGLIRLSFFESSRYSTDLVPGTEFFVISSGPNGRWGHDPCSFLAMISFTLAERHKRVASMVRLAQHRAANEAAR